MAKLVGGEYSPEHNIFIKRYAPGPRTNTWRKGGTLTPGGMHKPFAPYRPESLRQWAAAALPGTIHKVVEG